MKEEKKFLNKARYGNVLAFNLLFQKYRRELACYLFRLNADPCYSQKVSLRVFAEVFDLVQRQDLEYSTKVYAFRSGSQILLKSSKVFPWNSQTTRRVAKQVINQATDFYCNTSTTKSQQFELQNFISFCFNAHLKRLNTQKTMALLLKDVHYFQKKQIAFILGCPDHHIAHWLQQARTQLTTMFRHKCQLEDALNPCTLCRDINSEFHGGPQFDRYRRLFSETGGPDLNTYFRSELLRITDPYLCCGSTYNDYMTYVKSTTGFDHFDGGNRLK